jgi:hypothetical protein
VDIFLLSATLDTVPEHVIEDEENTAKIIWRNV